MKKSVSKATHTLVIEFLSRYPEEAANLLNDLPEDEILRLLQTITPSIVCDVLAKLHPDIAVEIIRKMEDAFFIKLFTRIDISLGTGLLSRLDEETKGVLISRLPLKLAKEYQELISYPPDSAGHLMDPNVTTFQMNHTVNDVLKHIRKIRNRRIIDICIIDEENRLQAVIPLQEIAMAQPNQRLMELPYNNRHVSIHSMAPREDVVTLMETNRLTSLPVIDLDGRLLGVIRYDALVSAAQHGVTEGIQVMFGAGRDERAFSKASFAIRKRLLWLEVNLGTAFLAAFVVSLFENTISKVTALAVFLPVVAGQSGNTGSQALAVTMRGLALREIRTRHWFRVMRKELTAGFFNGCAIALSTSIFVYLWMSSLGLAVIIGIAMVFSMVIAGVSGALIPITLKSMGQDPAQSSSIILTTVTDVVGFLSFLGLAKVLLGVLNLG
ncbi:MAG: magnesium transporter [Thermodesulfobacteriota bacterium]|nr:magnesium transporter [Thermodesulfobacteriota bacterium]